MKYILIILLQLVSYLESCAQTKDCTQCWKVTDEATNQFFNSLFANITGNDPNLALIKLDFVENEMLSITGIQVLRKYCKWKYNLKDSSVKIFTEQFIRNGTKIPLEDTLIFTKIDSRFYKFSDTALNKFRALGVKNFILKYCDGGLIKVDLHVSLLAFLFENRIFWNNLTGGISPYALRQIESSCKIKWDDKNEKWIDIRTNSAIIKPN